jgi:hypothetical protein
MRSVVGSGVADVSQDLESRTATGVKAPARAQKQCRVWLNVPLPKARTLALLIWAPVRTLLA